MSGFGSSGSGLGRVQGQNPFGSVGSKPAAQFDPWAASRAGAGRRFSSFDRTGNPVTIDAGQPGMMYAGGSATFDETGGFGMMGDDGSRYQQGALKPGGTYQNAPTPLLPGQSYPGFGNRYGPDQHQPGRGTPNTNPIPPGFQPPGTGVPWSMGGGLQTYGPDQHQPNRGTPNTTTQAPPWTGLGNVPWSMGGGLQTPMSDPFSVSAPNPQQAPQQAPSPQMIPGTNRPMPPGAFIDQYGIARRAPETPMNPGAGQFGQYTPGPNGFTLDQSGGMNRINGTLFSAEGLNQGGIAAPNYVDYLNRMFRR